MNVYLGLKVQKSIISMFYRISEMVLTNQQKNSFAPDCFNLLLGGIFKVFDHFRIHTKMYFLTVSTFRVSTLFFYESTIYELET